MRLPQLKVTYLNFNGRAEITRLTLAFGGVAFEDVRASGPEFAALRPTLPLGQVPVLEVDGVTYCQSMALARYAGRITDTYPTDALDALKVDSIVETLRDVITTFVDVNWKTPNEAEKAAKTKSFTEEGLPQIFGFLEQQVQGKFFLGEEASIADIFLFDLYTNEIEALFPDFKLSAYPKAEAIVANVAANAGIQAYLAKQVKYGLSIL